MLACRTLQNIYLLSERVESHTTLKCLISNFGTCGQTRFSSSSSSAWASWYSGVIFFVWRLLKICLWACQRYGTSYCSFFQQVTVAEARLESKSIPGGLLGLQCSTFETQGQTKTRLLWIRVNSFANTGKECAGFNQAGFRLLPSSSLGIPSEYVWVPQYYDDQRASNAQYVPS